jgi:hypothetical protein
MPRRLALLGATLVALLVSTVGLAAAGPANASTSTSTRTTYEALVAKAAREGKTFEMITPATLAGASGTPAVTTATSKAAPSCYGGAIWQYTSVSPTYFGHYFTTTDRCADINMRKSTEVTWDVDACVIFVDHTADCNYWTNITSSWKTIATNVANGTRFQVMVTHWWPDATGTTAVQFAF